MKTTFSRVTRKVKRVTENANADFQDLTLRVTHYAFNETRVEVGAR